MKYLILGSHGQLGTEFMRELGSRGAKVSGFDIDRVDVSDFGDMDALIKRERPDVLINCSAYNAVDLAETDFVTAFNANAIGPRNIAELARRRSFFPVHYSTDYVYDGSKKGKLYDENDRPAPPNQYGRSKLFGEKLFEEFLDDYLLFRVSWVYGPGKQNFIRKVSEWAESRDYLNVAADEVSVPTHTKLIVAATLKSLEKGLIGKYCLTANSYSSRYEWAKEIVSGLGINKIVYPASAKDFNLAAERPGFSAMSSAKLQKTLGEEFPHWRESLSGFLKSEIG